jgi:hypothetical protein
MLRDGDQIKGKIKIQEDIMRKRMTNKEEDQNMAIGGDIKMMNDTNHLDQHMKWLKWAILLSRKN